MDRTTEQQIELQIDGWMINGWRDEWMDKMTEQQIEPQMDGCINGWMDRITERQID